MWQATLNPVTEDLVVQPVAGRYCPTCDSKFFLPSFHSGGLWVLRLRNNHDRHLPLMKWCVLKKMRCAICGSGIDIVFE
jgi:hypothetical protein